MTVLHNIKKIKTFQEEDFQMTTEWVFFATSHGKSPCDRIDGTVKRTTARASLQRL